jgi:hypothetical protein
MKRDGGEKPLHRRAKARWAGGQGEQQAEQGDEEQAQGKEHPRHQSLPTHRQELQQRHCQSDTIGKQGIPRRSQGTGHDHAEKENHIPLHGDKAGEQGATGQMDAGDGGSAGQHQSGAAGAEAGYADRRQCRQFYPGVETMQRAGPWLVAEDQSSHDSTRPPRRSAAGTRTP